MPAKWVRRPTPPSYPTSRQSSPRPPSANLLGWRRASLRLLAASLRPVHRHRLGPRHPSRQGHPVRAAHPPYHRFAVPKPTRPQEPPVPIPRRQDQRCHLCPPEVYLHRPSTSPQSSAPSVPATSSTATSARSARRPAFSSPNP